MYRDILGPSFAVQIGLARDGGSHTLAMVIASEFAGRRHSMVGRTGLPLVSQLETQLSVYFTDSVSRLGWSLFGSAVRFRCVSSEQSGTTGSEELSIVLESTIVADENASSMIEDVVKTTAWRVGAATSIQRVVVG